MRPLHKLSLGSVVAAILSIAACTAQQSAQVTTTLAQAEAEAQAACATYAPVSAALATAPAGSAAAVTKGYIDGACDVATGQLTPAGLKNLDSSTAAWVAAGTALLKAAAAQAPATVPAKS